MKPEGKRSLDKPKGGYKDKIKISTYLLLESIIQKILQITEWTERCYMKQGWDLMAFKAEEEEE